MKLWFLWLGFVVSAWATLYCIFAILMVGSFAVAPGYSEERLEYNMSIWSPATFLFAFVTFVFFVLLVWSYYQRWRNKHRAAQRDT